MHQFPLHFWSDHQPLPTTGALLDIQHRGDGDASIAVGAVDDHTPLSLIGNEVLAACLTFEEDIGHTTNLIATKVSLPLKDCNSIVHSPPDPRPEKLGCPHHRCS
jgi:hypothetical protein